MHDVVVSAARTLGFTFGGGVHVSFDVDAGHFSIVVGREILDLQSPYRPDF